MFRTSRGESHWLLVICFLAIGVAALIAAPPPFVQYVYADGDCGPENPCGDCQSCSNGTCVDNCGPCQTCSNGNCVNNCTQDQYCCSDGSGGYTCSDCPCE